MEPDPRASQPLDRKPPAREGEDERYGTVAVTRLTKDDGRTVTLYRRADDAHP